MNTAQLDTLRSLADALQRQVERLSEGVTPDPTPKPDPLPEGTTTLAELGKVQDGQLSPQGWLEELESGPEGWIQQHAKDVGRHNAKMEYLHELALAEIGFAAFYTWQYADDQFPDHTRAHSRFVPTMLEVLAGAWTDALNAWKAYEAERESVYPVEESAA